MPCPIPLPALAAQLPGSSQPRVRRAHTPPPPATGVPVTDAAEEHSDRGRFRRRPRARGAHEIDSFTVPSGSAIQNCCTSFVAISAQQAVPSVGAAVNVASV